MKRILIIYIFLLGCAQTSLFAQFNEQPFPGQQGFGTGTNQMGANGDRTNGSNKETKKIVQN